MTSMTLTCPVCGCQSLEEDSGHDEWLCPQCDHSWPGKVVRGEQQLEYDTMAIRDEDGSYSLFELWFVDDPDAAKVIKLRSGLSRAEAQKETPYVNEKEPGF